MQTTRTRSCAFVSPLDSLCMVSLLFGIEGHVAIERDTELLLTSGRALSRRGFSCYRRVVTAPRHCTLSCG